MRLLCRFVLYAVLIWVVFCFQTALSASLSRFGATVDFLPPALGCIAVLEAPWTAAFLGLLAGFFRDAGSVSGIFNMLSLYFLTAAVSRISSKRFFPKIPVCAAAVFILLLLPESFAFLLRLPYSRRTPAAFLKSLLFEGVSSAAAFFPSFFICRRIHSLFPAEEKPFFASAGAERISSVLTKSGGKK